RRVIVEEFPDGGQLDMARVKKLVNRGRMSAYRMRQDARDFEITFKILIETNSHPGIEEIDEGSWRRICIIPYRLNLKKTGGIDETLEDTLCKEFPGILARAVRGCLDWQRRKLSVDVPECVLKETGTYRNDQDTLKEFLRACTEAC